MCHSCLIWIRSPRAQHSLEHIQQLSGGLTCAVSPGGELGHAAGPPAASATSASAAAACRSRARTLRLTDAMPVLLSMRQRQVLGALHTALPDAGAGKQASYGSQPTRSRAARGGERLCQPLSPVDLCSSSYPKPDGPLAVHSNRGLGTLCLTWTWHSKSALL